MVALHFLLLTSFPTKKFDSGSKSDFPGFTPCLECKNNTTNNSSRIFSIEVDPGFKKWHGGERGEGLLSEINRNGQPEVTEDESFSNH